MTQQDWKARDIQHLWHPYTDIEQFEQSAVYMLIERAEGVYLYEQGGRRLLDGIASWWCVNLGHSHPRLVQAIQRQAAQLQHCILGGMSHQPAIELAERLAQLAPGELNHVFFCSDGCSAVEAALKIAAQYWDNIGESGRNAFVCLTDGYHGDTLGAVSVGFVDAFHRPFKQIVLQNHRALSPHCNQCPMGKVPETCGVECFQSMENLIREHHERIVAVILEPLCQGAAGMRIYPDEYLRQARRLCDEYNLPLICDEIAVGFGRTGSLFASNHAGIEPDIITVGKGLTGGYMPLSATIVRTKIYDSFRNALDQPAGQNRTFFHGHTFTGNPITCACALAALDVYRETGVIERLAPRIAQLEQGFAAIAQKLPGSKTRCLGMIGMVEIFPESQGAARARRIVQAAYERGLFIRPLGNVLYLWPPLISTEQELAQMIEILLDSIESCDS
ncbi:adenosylmethionine--8-amino-7-oxononanoate transaminase [Candidatus Sumerlaeota bacterium]|nr:adenosylmethionine--8-amino-7-oxononanoate transaminase [Candidatus Sumerlaeota bacterium]